MQGVRVTSKESEQSLGRDVPAGVDVSRIPPLQFISDDVVFPNPRSSECVYPKQTAIGNSANHVPQDSLLAVESGLGVSTRLAA